MSKTMLIDAAHPEETRVVVLAGNQIDDFDFEAQAKRQIRGNIYLAKVTRVEPSLQASFVDYGGNRHGFLAFGEIHPDYYQIPAADREALLAEEAAFAAVAEEEGVDGDEEMQRARRAARRNYKIQEVIRRRQIMLVQAVKEERGNKGAALTTYLSLAGRYCVLMPNTPRGGGISRKITAVTDRKRLKKIVSDLDVPQGMGLIIRTAGAKRTKTEIKRDYEYLLRLWDNIRDLTLKSVAPQLIHEEDNLVKRAVRDLYDKDVDAILVEGEAAYREAKDFIKMLMPSHARKVQQYKGATPLFARMKVEQQLESIHSPVVQLRSGGYIVINQTEALVAIDVNSGRSTRERSIESTALKTNLEAADEAARQMRLRDLAGLVVIDFIDMEENRNDRAVEKRMKDALRFDRARVQMGKISGFGLLEISRQRRRTGVLEGSSHICPTCDGTGRVRSPESAALEALRQIEAAVATRRDCEVALRADVATAIYMLNEKRDHFSRLLQERGLLVRVYAESDLTQGQYSFEVVEMGEEVPEEDFVPIFVTIEDEEGDIGDEPIEDDDAEDEADDADEASSDSQGDREASEGNGEAGSVKENGRRRRRRRRPARRDEAGTVEAEGRADGENGDAEASEEEPGEQPDPDAIPGETAAEAQARRRRRRGRRGGRRRREGQLQDSMTQSEAGSESEGIADESETPQSIDGDVEAAPVETIVAEPVTDIPGMGVVNTEETDTNVQGESLDLPKSEPPPKRKRPARKPKVVEEPIADASPIAPVDSIDAQTVSEPVTAPEAETPADPIVDAAPAASTEPYSADAVAVEPPMAQASQEAMTTAPADEPADAGPRRSGWWSRNAKKLFGA